MNNSPDNCPYCNLQTWLGVKSHLKSPDRQAECKLNQARDALELCEAVWSDEVGDHSEVCYCDKCETRRMIRNCLKDTE